jgi:hypothetical protein
MGQVCIVIPVYKSFDKLSGDEVISWQQCLEVLAAHPICLVGPVTLDTAGYKVALEAKNIKYHFELFAPKSFANITGYNQLMISKEFYERFASYDYMLTYQLDAFIFKDELAQWCSLGYSYIGAPWFEGYEPNGKGNALWKVGNGGFTLRKISSCLRVLNTFSPIWSWSKLIKWYFRYGRKRGISKLPELLPSLFLGNNTHALFNDFYKLQEQFQEDYFWGVVCSEKFNWYKVPSPELALKFSFEVAPRVMYELNNYQLPMGCHAWDEYDPDFWKPFMTEATTAG